MMIKMGKRALDTFNYTILKRDMGFILIEWTTRSREIKYRGILPKDWSSIYAWILQDREKSIGNHLYFSKLGNPIDWCVVGEVQFSRRTRNLKRILDGIIMDSI